MTTTRTKARPRTSLWAAIACARADRPGGPLPDGATREAHARFLAGFPAKGTAVLAKALDVDGDDADQVVVADVSQALLVSLGTVVHEMCEAYEVVAFRDVVVATWAGDGGVAMAPVMLAPEDGSVPTIEELARLSGDLWLDAGDERMRTGMTGARTVEEREARTFVAAVVELAGIGPCDALATFGGEGPGTIVVAGATEGAAATLAAAGAFLPRLEQWIATSEAHRLGSSWMREPVEIEVSCRGTRSAIMRATARDEAVGRVRAWLARNVPAGEVEAAVAAIAGGTRAMAA